MKAKVIQKTVTMTTRGGRMVSVNGDGAHNESVWSVFLLFFSTPAAVFVKR